MLIMAITILAVIVVIAAALTFGSPASEAGGAARIVFIVFLGGLLIAGLMYVLGIPIPR